MIIWAHKYTLELTKVAPMEHIYKSMQIAGVRLVFVSWQENAEKLRAWSKESSTFNSSYPFKARGRGMIKERTCPLASYSSFTFILFKPNHPFNYKPETEKSWIFLAPYSQNRISFSSQELAQKPLKFNSSGMNVNVIKVHFYIFLFSIQCSNKIPITQAKFSFLVHSLI